MKKIYLVLIIVVVVLGSLYLLGRKVSLSPDASLNDPNGEINGCGYGQDCHYVCQGDSCVEVENRANQGNYCDPNQINSCKNKLDSGGVLGTIGTGIRKVICTVVPGAGAVICH